MGRINSRLVMVVVTVLIAVAAHPQDVKIRPAPGSGVVVTNAAGSIEQLRVNDSGLVFLPTLLAHPAPDRFLCIDTATGRVGTCAVPVGGAGPAGPPGPAGAGLTWKGPWTITTTYAINDVVSNAGSAWIAVAANTGQQPGTSASWNLMAQKGADAPAGPDIVQVCASEPVTCVGGPTCPLPPNQPPSICMNAPPNDPRCDATAHILTAQCPAGYIRLGVVNCKEPGSNGIYATIFLDPYDNTTAECRYHGLVEQGNPDTLAIRALCIKELFAPPCLVP